MGTSGGTAVIALALAIVIVTLASAIVAAVGIVNSDAATTENALSNRASLELILFYAILLLVLYVVVATCVRASKSKRASAVTASIGAFLLNAWYSSAVTAGLVGENPYAQALYWLSVVILVLALAFATRIEFSAGASQQQRQQSLVPATTKTTREGELMFYR